MALENINDVESSELYDSPSHSPPAEIQPAETVHPIQTLPPPEISMTKDVIIEQEIFIQTPTALPNTWKSLYKKKITHGFRHCFCCTCFTIVIVICALLLLMPILPAIIDFALLVTSLFFTKYDADGIVFIFSFCFFGVTLISAMPLFYIAIICIIGVFKCSSRCFLYVDSGIENICNSDIIV